MSNYTKNIDVIIRIIQKGSDITKSVSSQLKNIASAAAASSKSMGAADKAAAKMSQSISNFSRNAGKASNDLTKLSNNSKKAASSFGKTAQKIFEVNDAFGAMGNILQRALLVTAIRKSGSALIDTTLQWTRFKNMLMFVYDDAGKAKDALSFLSDTADRLGVSFESSVEGFSQMAAAAKGSRLEGEGVEKIYTALVTAGSALGLSQDKLSHSFYAITQMMSKGTVQTEELKRQLADQLPGAYEMAAKSMGMTKKAFMSLIESGKLLADDFLPRFAAYLTNRFTPTAEENSKSIIGSFNRMKNAWFKFKVALSEGDVSDSFSKSFKKIQDILEDPQLIESTKQLIKVFADLTGTILEVVKTSPEFVAWSVILGGALTTILALGAPLATIVGSLIELKAAAYGVTTTKAVGELANLEKASGLATTKLGALIRVMFTAATAAGVAGLITAIGVGTYALLQYIDAETGAITKMEEANLAEEARQQSLENLNARLYDVNLATGINVKTQDDLNMLVAQGVIAYDKNTGALQVNKDALWLYTNGAKDTLQVNGELFLKNMALVGAYDKVYALTGRVISSERELNQLVKAGVIELDKKTGAMTVNEEKLKALRKGNIDLSTGIEKVDEANKDAKKSSYEFAQGLIKAGEEMDKLDPYSLADEIKNVSKEVILMFDGTVKGMNVAATEYQRHIKGLTDTSLINTYYKVTLAELDRALAEGQITEERYREERYNLELANWNKIIDVQRAALDRMIAAGDTSSKEFQKTYLAYERSLKKRLDVMAEYSKKTEEEVSNAAKKAREKAEKAFKDQVDSVDKSVEKIKTSAKIQLDELEIAYSKGLISKKKYDRKVIELDKETNKKIIAALKKKVELMVQKYGKGSLKAQQAMLELRDAELDAADAANDAGDKMKGAADDSAIAAMIAAGEWDKLADAIGQAAANAARFKAQKLADEQRRDANSKKKYTSYSAPDFFTSKYGDPSSLSNEEIDAFIKKLTPYAQGYNPATDEGGWWRDYFNNMKKYIEMLKQERKERERLAELEKLNEKKSDLESDKDVASSEYESAVSSISRAASDLTTKVSKEQSQTAKELMTAYKKEEITKEEYDKKILESEATKWRKIRAIRQEEADKLGKLGKDNTDALDAVKDAEIELDSISADLGKSISYSLSGSEEAALHALSSWNKLISSFETAKQLLKDIADLEKQIANVSSDIDRKSGNHKFARGGKVPGSGNTDKVKSLLTPGEFVIKKSTVKRLGVPFFNALNNGRIGKQDLSGFSKFASGGWVNLSASSLSDKLSYGFNSFLSNYNQPLSSSGYRRFADGGIVPNGDMVTLNIVTDRGQQSGMIERSLSSYLIDELNNAKRVV